MPSIRKIYWLVRSNTACLIIIIKACSNKSYSISIICKVVYLNLE